MTSVVIDKVILILGLLLPVYLILRFKKWGYLFGIVTVWSVLSLSGSGFWARDASRSMEIINHDWLIWGWLWGLAYCTVVYAARKPLLQLKKSKMKTRLIAVGLIGTVLVGACVLAPRLFRCYAYFRLISEPSTLASLSVKPRVLEIDRNMEAAPVSLGYAQLSMPPESMRSLKCKGTVVIIDCGDANSVLMTPLSVSHENFRQKSIKTADIFDPLSQLRGDGEKEHRQALEKTERNPIVGRMMRDMADDRYNWSLRVVNTMPKTYTEIFHQTASEFTEYMLLAGAKAMIYSADSEVTIVDAEHVNAIVHFGAGMEPGRLYTEIYSKQSNITQGVHVYGPSLESCKKSLLSLLSSYKFLIQEVPDGDRLRNMIAGEIEKHEKFKPVE